MFLLELPGNFLDELFVVYPCSPFYSLEFFPEVPPDYLE
jgi:hypothetical protein